MAAIATVRDVAEVVMASAQGMDDEPPWDDMSDDLPF